MKPRSQQKNCTRCVHLKYFDDGFEGPEAGFFCDGRDFRYKNEEDAFLKRINNEKFQLTGKKCFEPKQTFHKKII